MGGGDIPASGFALYIDRLMNLVEPDILREPVRQSVLVRAEGNEEVKEAFNVASRLRDGGYTAELDLGNRELANVRWLLEIRAGQPKYTLRDIVGSGQTEVQTIDEVLGIIEEKSGHQDSLTKRAPSG
jgi:histidyl-tRNA synthetase